MLSKAWMQHIELLDRQQLHEEMMALIWLKEDPEKIEWLRFAERERMGVENFIAHQFGPRWPVRKTYSAIVDNTPPGVA